MMASRWHRFSRILRMVKAIGILILSSSLMQGIRADDWPQWNGPTRTGIYSESGIIDRIPAEGLKLQWSAAVQGGYSGPAISQGRVFLTDFEKETGTIQNDPGKRAELTGRERILCFDAKTGEQRWVHAYARKYSISYPAGPRVTPVVDADRVYSLGAEGDLLCLSVNDGKVIWKINLPEQYKAETPIWGYSSAPLILGDQLICLAGGKGSIVVSLDKMTGKEKWRALDAKEIGYAPPTLIEAGGKKQLLIWDAQKLHSLDSENGKEYWSMPLEPSYGMSIMAPVRSGNLLFASGIGQIGAMFELDSKQPAAKQLWKGNPKNAMYCANSTPYFDGEYVYGCDCGKGTMVCFRASDGERMWETFEPTGGGTNRISHGTCFLNKVGDHYFLLSETGDFIIAKLSPEKYEELGRFHVIDPTNECFGRSVVWSYPAYANRSLFVRNDRELKCYSLEK